MWPTSFDVFLAARLKAKQKFQKKPISAQDIEQPRDWKHESFNTDVCIVHLWWSWHQQQHDD